MVDLFEVLLLLGEGGIITKNFINCFSTTFELVFKMNHLPEREEGVEVKLDQFFPFFFLSTINNQQPQP